MAGQPGDDDRGDDDRGDSYNENENQIGSVMIIILMIHNVTITIIIKYLPTARVTCGQLLPPIRINFSHLKSQVEFISVKKVLSNFVCTVWVLVKNT